MPFSLGQWRQCSVDRQMGFLKEYKAGIIRITLKPTNNVEVFGEMECGMFWLSRKNPMQI